ncbi:MAG: TlpA family protein disulfide reductase, partial [Acidobacteria bacterium]|nr:TlpA family protein disulfide reductase [Acidobacteriota bacterium]
VEFVAVSEDAGGWSDIEAFVQETPIAYPVLLDRDENAGQAVGGLPGLPVTVFVDRRGRMAYKHVGITDINTLRTNIERLLESSAGVSP